MKTQMPIISLSPNSRKHTFYVSPNGSDRWDGTRQKPFRTLKKARNVIRKSREGRQRASIVVCGGTHNVYETLLLTPRDSNLILCAEDDGEPVLSGARSILGPWRTYKNRIWVVSIPENWHFPMLFFNGKSLPRSCSVKDDDWCKWPTGRLSGSNDRLIVKPKDLSSADRYENTDLNFLPTPYTYWSNVLTRVKALDRRKGHIIFAPVKLHRPEVLKAIPFRMENMFSGIKKPGQWYVDSRKGRLYLWPPDDSDPNEAVVTAPFLTQLIVLKGSRQTPVSSITIKGISIQRAAIRRTPLKVNGSGFEPEDAAVRISGAESCEIENCRILEVSGNAISGAGYIKKLRVSGCEISRCGGGGISISGGLKTPEASCSKNIITDNHIHHCGVLYWHSSAITVGLGEKNRIAHNYIHHMPYAGILTGGVRHRSFANWPAPQPELARIWKKYGKGIPTIVKVKKLIPGYNRIEFNYIHDVMEQLDDGAGIYCHAGHHNRVRYNFVYRTVRAFSHGLYFDDEEMDSLMEYNIVWRCPDMDHTQSGSCFHLHHNARNTVRNNIFGGVDPLFSCNNGYGGHRITCNTFLFPDHCSVSGSPAPVHGPGDGRRQEGWDAGPSIMDYNLYWSIKGELPVKLFLKEWRAKGYDKNSVIGNPLFVNAKKSNCVTRGQGNLPFVSFDEKELNRFFCIIVGFLLNGLSLFAAGKSTKNVVGDIKWPREWRVFGPLDRRDPVPSSDILQTIPKTMRIKGKKIPGEAVIFENGKFDFQQMFGGKKWGNEGKTAYAFTKLKAKKDMEITMGAGADWWMQWWIDGRPVYDTLEDGNLYGPPSIKDYIFSFYLTKGEHILAVRFISGRASSVLVTGGPGELRRLVVN